jgi:hypothetical protein
MTDTLPCAYVELPPATVVRVLPGEWAIPMIFGDSADTDIALLATARSAKSVTERQQALHALVLRYSARDPGGGLGRAIADIRARYPVLSAGLAVR